MHFKPAGKNTLANDKFIRLDTAYLRFGSHAFKSFAEILSTPVDFLTFNFEKIFLVSFSEMGRNEKFLSQK